VCLIVVAHRVSDRFPLVIAANRDEEYARPTRAAHFWDDHPDVLGGRDLRAGGTWLAITRNGRVAAVTNLRGEAKPGARSRGVLVGDFVTSNVDPMTYAQSVQKEDFAGFHLIVGVIGGAFVHLADELRVWSDGIHGVSNGPVSERSEKIDVAVEHMREALVTEDAEELARDLMAFFARPPAFVASELYGTRSTTAIVASRERILFVEQSYGEVARLRSYAVAR